MASLSHQNKEWRRVGKRRHRTDMPRSSTDTPKDCNLSYDPSSSTQSQLPVSNSFQVLNLIAKEDASNTSGGGAESTALLTHSEGLLNSAEATTLKPISEAELLATTEVVREKPGSANSNLKPAMPPSTLVDQISHPMALNLASAKTSAEKGKEPVADLDSLTYSRSTTLPDDLALVKRAEFSTKHPLISLSPSSSPCPRTSKLASKVKLIDGVIPRILHKGEALPESMSSLENRVYSESDSASHITGLNARPHGVSS